MNKSYKEVALGDIATSIRNGLSIKQNGEAGGLPITRIETIANGTIDPNRVGFAGLKEGDKDEWFLENGDILVRHINSTKHLGKCAIYENKPKKLIHGMNLLSLKCAPEKAYPRYVYHALQSPMFKSKIPTITKNSVNQSSFTVTNFKGLKIPLPPLPEQKRIAAILDKADAIRRKRQQAIKLADEFLRSVFLDMFGDPVTNPKGWEIKKLGEVCTKITDGVHRKPEYYDDGIPFISVKNITTGRLIFDESKYVSQTDHEFFCKRCNPEYHDILYTKVGATYGRPALVDSRKEFSLYVSVALLKPNRTIIDPKFLKEVLSSPGVKHQADRSIKGAGVPDLHLVEIKKILIPLPPKKVQEDFLLIADTMHTLIGKNQKSAREDNLLFSSLTQKAFRGEL